MFFLFPQVAVLYFTLSESQPTLASKSNYKSATENLGLSLASPTAGKNAVVGLKKSRRRTITI